MSLSAFLAYTKGFVALFYCSKELLKFLPGQLANGFMPIHLLHMPFSGVDILTPVVYPILKRLRIDAVGIFRA
jgi:hypothetical protein